jgi:hypothetical protein
MKLPAIFRKNHNNIPDKVPGEITGLNEDTIKYAKETGSRSSDFFPGDGSIGLDAIYAFLQDDFESRGYNDALTNPEEGYKSDNIRLLGHDLLILIDRSTNYYESFLKELDFHIGSRSRAGLIDLVEELKIRKDIIMDHLEKIGQIKAEAASGSGSVQRISLSYSRGFMRGLSAISQSKIFKRTL